MNTLKNQSLVQSLKIAHSTPTSTFNLSTLHYARRSSDFLGSCAWSYELGKENIITKRAKKSMFFGTYSQFKWSKTNCMNSKFSFYLYGKRDYDDIKTY